MTRSAVVEATAEVRSNGKRSGSAILVDKRHLLTAWHVISGAARSESKATVTVKMPGAKLLTVTVSPLGESASSADLAVLDLGEQDEGALPDPPECWAGLLMPRSVEVYGYPKEDTTGHGVWRTFRVSGPTNGKIQLDWEDNGGTFEGHSGGPVIDAESHALVGILVQGSARGRFDRFLPITTIAGLWPGLRRPWILAGENPRSHAVSRAYARRMRLRGDFFRGRDVALGLIEKWFTASSHPGRPLVITGQPGAGKSAVLCRAALETEKAQHVPGALVHARNADSNTLAVALSRATGTDEAGIDTVLDNLADLCPPQPLAIAVDALDEVGDEYERRRIASALRMLADLPAFRVVVATRPLSGGDRFRADSILRQLGVESETARNLIDLDAKVHQDVRDVRAAALAVLTDSGTAAGTAAAFYHRHSELAGLLAERIAERSRKNFLVASITAAELAAREQIVDPEDTGFRDDSLPSDLGEVITGYLRTLDQGDRKAIRNLLLALAYGRGSGLTDSLWLEFAAALGYVVEISDIETLRHGPGYDYLIETATQEEGRLTRLFHQALVDQLLVDRDERDDHRKIFEHLAGAARESGWGDAAPYSRAHIAEHAARGESLEILLQDAEFIANAHILPLLGSLRAAPAAARTPIGQIILQHGLSTASDFPTNRLQVLGFAAEHLGLQPESQWLLSAASTRLRPRWAQSLGAATRTLVGHRRYVNAVTLGLFGARVVVASAGDDAVIRLWDELGAPVGEPLTGHSSEINALAAGRLNSQNVLVSGGVDGTIRVWHEDRRPTQVVAGHTGSVRSVAVGHLAGEDVIVSGGADHTVRVWGADGRSLATWSGHRGWVNSVAIGTLAGRSVIASGSNDLTVRIWDVHGDFVTLPGSSDWVRSVTIGRFHGHDVVIAGGEDKLVRVWDDVGKPVAALQGHAAAVNTVALGRWNGSDAIISAGNDHTVRVWTSGRLDTGQVLTGHSYWVRGVAAGRLAGQDVIVSAAADRTVRIWEAAPSSTMRPLLGHSAFIRSAAAGVVDNSEIIVSAGGDNTLRLWDVKGLPLSVDWQAETDHIRAVLVGLVGGQNRIVTAYRNICVWDRNGRLVGGPHEGHRGGINALAVGRLGQVDLIASGGDDYDVRLWTDGGNYGQPLVGHVDIIRSLAIGRLARRDLVVSASDDATLRVWDVSEGTLAATLRGHDGPVKTVVVGQLADDDVIVSGGSDGTIRLWDSDLRAVRTLTGHNGTVRSIALGQLGSRDVIVSTGADRTLRVWDGAGRLQETVVLIAPGNNLDIRSNTLLLSSGPALVSLALAPDSGRVPPFQR